MKMWGAKVCISIVRLMDDVFEREMSMGKRKALVIFCSHGAWDISSDLEKACLSNVVKNFLSEVYLNEHLKPQKLGTSIFAKPDQ